MAERFRSRWVFGLALVAFTLVAYLPAHAAGFIWDDDWYVTKNELLHDVAGLVRIWVPGHTVQYYPVVFTSFWIEHHLWGLEPAGYHVVNVLLHALNALLVWRLARGLGIPGAWWIGAAFALHPVHVESVAWITERKNVLSGAFYLSAALAYLRFEELRGCPSPPARRGAWYAAAFGLFLLALLSKTVTCSLPAALVLMRLWQQRSVALRALAPMFVVGLVLALHTAHLERTRVGAQGAEFALSFVERTWIAGKALLFYPSKLLVPWPLVFIYPRWDPGAATPSAHWSTAVVLFVAAVACLAYARGVRGPGLALAFFAGSLLPALGFFDVYPMRYSFVADHFQYLASLGILALVIGPIAARFHASRAGVIVGAAMIVCLGALTWRRAGVFSDPETLWRETIRLNPAAWMAHNNLALVLTESGRNAEALESLRAAQAAATGEKASRQIRRNLAITLGKLGRDQEALEAYLELQHAAGGMELELARTLERLGRDEEAEAYFRGALAGEGDPAALVPFGVHLMRRGRPEEALIWLERSVALHPDDADALMFLADAYAGAGRLADAIASGERALLCARARGDERMAELVRRRVEQYRSSGG